MITVINESKILTKHISCERKCKLGGTKCNSNQMWNNNKYQCECKKSILYVKNIILENPSLETRLCVIKL